MTKEPQPGDRSTCAVCGARIRLVAAGWVHSKQPREPHRAVPREEREIERER